MCVDTVSLLSTLSGTCVFVEWVHACVWPAGTQRERESARAMLMVLWRRLLRGAGSGGGGLMGRVSCVRSMQQDALLRDCDPVQVALMQEECIQVDEQDAVLGPVSKKTSCVAGCWTRGETHTPGCSHAHKDIHTHTHTHARTHANAPHKHTCVHARIREHQNN